MNSANDHSSTDREERAIDALITGILHPPTPPQDIQADEIAPYVGPEEPTLSLEAEAALAKLGPDPLARILPNSCSTSPPAAAHQKEVAAEYCGMYRNNPTDQNNAEDEHELEKRRRATLRKLNESKDQSENSSDAEEH